MSSLAAPHRSVVANAIYGLLNPIPFGFFVAALIFDITYANTAVVLWGKGADWLISLGLLFAVIPRLINLVQVWITSRRFATRAERLDFWLNLFAIVARAMPMRWYRPAFGSRYSRSSCFRSRTS